MMDPTTGATGGLPASVLRRWRGRRRHWRASRQWHPMLVALLLLGGCAQWAAVQTDLIDQASRGIDLTKRSMEGKGALIEKEYRDRRRRLDRAFDADVAGRQQLTDDWVIDARRAYAAALDALNDGRDIELANDAIDRRNLQAVREALENLRRLQLIQSKWLPTEP